MAREHEFMHKNRGSSDLKHCIIKYSDFSRLEGASEGSGSQTVSGNLNPMLEMDSAHAKTYSSRKSMLGLCFIVLNFEKKSR